MLLKISIKDIYINNKLLKAFAKGICIIFILFKIRFKEDGVKAGLKKDFIIIILKLAAYCKIMIFLKINKNLTTFTLL